MYSSSLRKTIHLFVLHSPITLLLAQLIIQHRRLSPEQVYIITNSGIYQAALQLTNAQHICFNHAFDNCIAQLNYHGLVAKEQIRLQLSLYEHLHHWLTPDFQVDLTQIKAFLELDALRAKTQFFGQVLASQEQNTSQADRVEFNQLDLLGVDFELYVPQLNGWIFNNLAHHPNCCSVHIIEEGSLDYVNTMIKPEPWHVQTFAQFVAQHPQTQQQHTGVKHYHHHGHFKVSGINNPRLNLSQCCYFCLNEMAFAYDNCDAQMRKVVLDYQQLPQLNLHSVHTQQDQAYARIAKLVEQNHQNGRQGMPLPDSTSANTVANHKTQSQALNFSPTQDISGLVNVLVLDNLIFADSDNPLFYYEQLIIQIKARGVFYFLVKFHPLQQAQTRLKIMDLIARMQVYAEYLRDDFSLEHLFAHASPFSICCHSVGSSVLLYAATMQQLALSYQEILKDDTQYQQLYLNSNYQLRAWLRLSYLKNKQVIAM